MLSISEIFYSIQGEGPNAGYPAIFLRTAGCNLRCTWCDTPYALELRQGKKMSADEIVAEIKKFPCQHLIITGGEPMIQQTGMSDILAQLPEFFVEIETNGGFASEIDEYIHQYNCSPKLPHSGNKAYELKIKPSEKVWYKFVIGSEDELQKTIEYIKQNNLPKARIRLMPLGDTPESSKECSIWLIERCKELGYIFNPRVHVLIWGNTLGT